MDSVDLEEIADRLYALPLDAFTGARDESARSVVPDLKKSVKGLRKPTVAAHVVNLLVRERGDEVGQLLELGTQLRSAMGGDPAEVRRLSERRRSLITALVDPDLPPAVQQDVTATLEAATADAAIAAAVRSGRLVKPLRYAGFGDLPDLDDAVAGPLPAAPPAVNAAGAVSAAAAPRATRRAAGGKPAERPSKRPAPPAGTAAGDLSALRQQVLDLAGAADDAQRRYDLAVDRVEEARRLLELAEAERAEAHKAARAAHAAAEKARRDLGRLERR